MYNFEVSLKQSSGGTAMFSESYYINPKSDSMYHFLGNLDPNGRPLGSKSTGIW